MTPTVVIRKLPNGEFVVFGPFPSPEAASRWGFDTWGEQGEKVTWFWEYMFTPKAKGE